MKSLKYKMVFRGIEQTVEDIIVGQIQGYPTACAYYALRPEQYPNYVEMCVREAQSRAAIITGVLA